MKRKYHYGTWRRTWTATACLVRGGEAFPRRSEANPIIKDNVSDATFQNLLDGRAVPMLFGLLSMSCGRAAASVPGRS